MKIISLTTTASRLDICAHAVFSLIHQTLMPDKIIVWVSHEAYLLDTGVAEIPLWLNEINAIKNIVEFRWTKNTGPYRKLLPLLAITENKEDLIITADDDLIYGINWIKLLVESANQYPDAVIAARVRKIEYNFFGIQTSYNCWPIYSNDQRINKDYIVTFGGGAVFRVGFIKPELIKSTDYLTLSPTADDLWFSEIIKATGTDVVICTAARAEISPITHEKGLMNLNIVIGSNTLTKIYNNLILKLIGYLGFSTCQNDIFYSGLRKFFSQRNK